MGIGSRGRRKMKRKKALPRGHKMWNLWVQGVKSSSRKTIWEMDYKYKKRTAGILDLQEVAINPTITFESKSPVFKILAFLFDRFQSTRSILECHITWVQAPHQTEHLQIIKKGYKLIKSRKQKTRQAMLPSSEESSLFSHNFWAIS